MGSQDTVVDDTFNEGHQGDIIYQISESADLANTNAHCNGKGEVKQLSESKLYKINETASRNARHQPEENDTKIQRLWNELNDLRAEQKLLSIREDDVLSRLQDAVGYKVKPTQSSLPKSHKILRWASSVDDYSPNNDTHRSGKRARKGSQP